MDCFRGGLLENFYSDKVIYVLKKIFGTDILTVCVGEEQ